MKNTKETKTRMCVCSSLYICFSLKGNALASFAERKEKKSLHKQSRRFIYLVHADNSVTLQIVIGHAILISLICLLRVSTRVFNF